MNARLAVVAAAQHGVFSTPDATGCGVSSSTLDRWVRAGEVVRVRRSAHVLAESWEAASPEERHRLTTRAILRTRPARDLASHHAAVGLSRIATWGVDLDVVDLSSSGTAVRRRGDLRLHPRVGSAAVLVDGAPAVPLALALVQTAAWSGIVPGVCSIDDALHREQCTTADLVAAVALLPEHERDRARAAVDLADGRSGSVGETRTRLLLQDLGFRCTPQFEMLLPSGRLAYGDLLVDEVVVVEFDGLVKYEGLAGARALADEKVRERGIWDLGYEVERVVWADLDAPARLRHRVIAARSRAVARGLVVPGRGHPHGAG